MIFVVLSVLSSGGPRSDFWCLGVQDLETGDTTPAEPQNEPESGGSRCHSLQGVSSSGSCEGNITRAVRKTSHIVVEDAGMQFSFVARKGVYYDKRRRLWRANWKENGRIHTKGFSVHGTLSHGFPCSSSALKCILVWPISIRLKCISVWPNSIT